MERGKFLSSGQEHGVCVEGARDGRSPLEVEARLGFVQTQNLHHIHIHTHIDTYSQTKYAE